MNFFNRPRLKVSGQSEGKRTPMARLVPAWLQHTRDESSQEFWAWEEVEDRVGERGDLEDGWLLVLELIESALPEDLSNIAAGALESLIRSHSVVVVDRVVRRAAEDAKFQQCLGDIWLGETELPPEEMARVVWASGGRIEPMK